MRIKVWQAYASNNSGSYTIVGTFESAEKASEVADVLREMAVAHSAWFEGLDDAEDKDDAKSPLATFSFEHALPWQSGMGVSDDWPEHGEKTVPEIVAAGHQVLVHVGYTVSMPATFGAFFYKRGGRVSIELDHAHGPIVAMYRAWWRDREQVEPALKAVLAELTGSSGLLVTSSPPLHPPAWQLGDGYDFALACVLDDLCAGFKVISETLHRHGAYSRVDVAELHEHINPLAALRPCRPASATPRYDVWLGKFRKTSKLRKELAVALDTNEYEMDPLLQKAPGVVLECLFEPHAQRVAEVLKAHEVEHELHPVP